MIDVKLLQTRLLKHGYEIGAVDGSIGPKTLTGLLARVASRPMEPLAEIGSALSKYAARFGLLENPARLANFVGQTCHETGNFRYMREIWGPTKAQMRYEGRKDLGNTELGDGKRFMGRGMIQITGRANYTEMAMRSGLPILDSPEIVEKPDAAVLISCIWWKKAGINAFADSGDEDGITRRINGGENGIADRRKLVGIAKALLL